jgi:hypothetical protein
MGTEQNKEIVTRFMDEVASGRNFALVDELCAPDYVNIAAGGADLDTFKAMAPPR